MIRVHITEEQIRYTQDLIESCNFGNRGKFDGDMSKQLIGMLGQTVVADYLENQDHKYHMALMEVMTSLLMVRR